MKTNRLVAATALATTVCLIAVSPASAQDTTPADDAAAEDTIIVTGSRIRSPNLESIAPITTITASELTNSGSVSIGDALSDLPSLRSTFTSANSTRAIGTTGLSLLDLRGLGIERTLVLQNSKRLVSATEGDNLVDVSSIPSALIDRVDIVTGGTSAVYGSDAIAGVVNFVLKENYDGISVRGQSGISSKGDRPTQALSLTAGTNFAEGRGNIAASVEYSHNGQLKIPDRSFTRVRFQLQQVQFDPAGTNSDGVPDRQFFGDVRSLILSQGGTFVPTISTTNPATFIARTNPDGTVVRVARVYRFNSDGSISQANYGTRDFRFGTLTDGVFNNGGANNTLGGDGETLRDMAHDWCSGVNGAAM